MQGIAIDFETNGFYGSSVLSVAAIKFTASWETGNIHRIETFERHYHPTEKWNRHAQAVNRLSSSKSEKLRAGASYCYHFRDDHALSSFASDAEFAVAHNASFDSHFAKLPLPWICTMKLGGGRLADAAKARVINVNETCLHHALYDTEICLALFAHLLREGKVPPPTSIP